MSGFIVECMDVNLTGIVGISLFLGEALFKGSGGLRA